MVYFLLLLTTLVAVASAATDATGFGPVQTWSLKNLQVAYPSAQVSISAEGASIRMPQMTATVEGFDPAIPGFNVKQSSFENSQINFSPQAASTISAYTMGWYPLHGYAADPSGFTLTADVSPDMKIINVREFKPIV